jgi:L-threonylcarbamoyladenylate synthase
MPTIDARQPATLWVDQAVAILRRGGLVAFPTETVYGLGARALDRDAIARVFEAKGRPRAHPLIAHVLGATEARAISASWPSSADRLARAFWPGPLTLVVPRAAQVPPEIAGGSDSIAIRSPSHPVARTLLAALGEPIAAPSANTYQSISPTTAAHVARSLGDRVDLILDGGPCEAGIESTVVDVRGRVPLLLRPGALDLVTLQRVEPATAVPDSVDSAEDDSRPSPGMDRRHYAPRTPLHVARTRTAALDEAHLRQARGEHVALLLVSPLDTPVGSVVRVVVLGPSPEGYAHGLYAALHDLDDLRPPASVILVEPVPAAAAWYAISDRLRRAATPVT